MKTKRSAKYLILIIVLLSLITGACRFIMGPDETPTPTSGPPTLEPTAAPPTDTPTLAPPTATPGPTPTPMPLPAPRLLFRMPETGETHAPNAPIELTFDQPMDAQSVRQAFTISPTVAGELVWSDTRTLRFTPAQHLARGAVYRVSVDADALNAEGEPLREPISFDVQTFGYLEVSEVQPLPGSQNVSPDNAVTVVFNRPVVPLTSLDRQDELPVPLRFDPPVAGVGEWLNTAIYRFRPTDGFKPATHYQGIIDAGLTDTTGNILPDSYMWTFSTQRPKVVAFSPRHDAEHVAPTAVISVTFNQPMNRASVENAFQVKINGTLVTGTFRWGKPQPGDFPADVARFETMGFVPDAPLPRDVVCTAGLYALSYARDSDVALQTELLWNFSIVKTPGIISTSPFNGETAVSPNRDVHITFASPMLRDSLMNYLDIIPRPTRVYTYWRKFDTELRLSFYMTPTTTYRLTLSPDVPDKYGEVLGHALDLRFTTGNLSPYAYLNTPSNLGTFNAYTATAVYASYRNVSRLDVALYRLSPEIFMKLHAYGDYEYRQNFVPRPTNLIRAWSVDVNPPPNQDQLIRLDMLTAEGLQLPPDIYYVIMTAPERLVFKPDTQPSTYTFIRSHINLTLKQTPNETLVWATDLSSGQPKPGLAVRFNTEQHGWHGDGVTDAEGLYLVNAAKNNLWDDFCAFSGEPGAATFAVAWNAWDDGIRPWNFNLISDYGEAGHVGYLYTDRPIYRPGQTVYFKGIVRADDDAHYTIPLEMTTLDVVISDPQGKELYNETLPLNDMGTFHGELALDDIAALGSYYIQSRSEKHNFYASTSFRLAEYRKPEFQVAVQTDTDAYLNNDTLKVTVDATYYFGGPVTHADVHWNLLSGNYWFRYQCPTGEKCPWYSWRDYEWSSSYEGESYGGYGRRIADGDAVTDAAGRVTFEIPADIADELNSRTFTIEANVTDINNQYVSNRTRTVVHKGEFYVGIAPQGRIAKEGEEKTVDILTVDWDSAPVPDVMLDVIFTEHHWYNVRQQAEDGQYYWTWVVEEIPVFTTTATTDDAGKAVTTFTPPKSGSYRVRATGVDQQGNEIRSSTYLWVWGGGRARWRQESTNRIDLIVDQDEYHVGDVAEILIPSPYTGTVKALITIERGHILHREIRELRSNTELLRIPIEAAHAPNIFVSVVIIQGAGQTPNALASFKMGVVQLPVSIEEKELLITLTPDKDSAAEDYYHPRDTVTYDVRVTDHAGQPMETELSLRLADLAVLALADESGPTLLERYWSQRGLNVRTAMPLALAMEAYNRELAPQAKGGGGGGEDDGFVRTQFADTAYWNPVVRTDARGRATVEVKLPDNLTTWRMQARGITRDTRVGRAEVDVISTRDLLVRPVLPRFFVVGDKADIATIVHNNTAQTLATDIVLSVEGLEVTGTPYQTVNIPPGGKVKVIWPVTVLPPRVSADAAGPRVSIQMEAEAGSYYDGWQGTLPVYFYSTPEVMATAGRLSEPEIRQELVQLPRIFDPTQGELTVQVAGSLTAATADALDYLKHYPYECVEQTVSRFLPNVLTYQTLKEMGIARPELKSQLTTQVQVALQRLYAQQHYDGGWGWWQSDDSSPYLTAYVLHGMLEAYRAGFTVDLDVINWGAAYLRENLAATANSLSHWRANRLAYQLYVLGEYLQLIADAEPAGELGYAIQLFEQRERLDLHGKATLAVALGLLEPEEKSRVNTLLSDFAGQAIYSATGTHWEEPRVDYWNMNTDTRTTAVVLWAMTRHLPDSELLPTAVRWLMSVRDGDAHNRRYWESTYTTSWVMMSLVAYMRASGEMQGDFSYTVTLNGDVVLADEINADTIDESHQVQIAIAQLLADEGNRLLIQRQPASTEQSGAGQLYYTAHLRYFLPAADVPAAERGIIVARQYERVGGSANERVREALVGDLIRVKLTVIAPTNLHYVVVEDPLPAGCEAVDLGLKTTSVVGEAPSIESLSASEEDVWYRRYGWGWWWFSHTEIRDEKVALFATYLPRGTYEYSYVMRASLPGEFNVIPTTAYEMYFPEVWGRSAGEMFVVKGE